MDSPEMLIRLLKQEKGALSVLTQSLQKQNQFLENQLRKCMTTD